MSRYLRLTDARVRAKRIASETGFIVESKTIGTEMAFNLETENLSRTGFLLNTGAYKRVPFLVNTILELKVDTRGRMFKEPVLCLGKVVRVDSETELDDDGAPLKRYGIQIVQMEQRDMEQWEKAVHSMERIYEAVTEKEVTRGALPAA